MIDIRGTELQGKDDFRLFEVAQQNKAILLTTDRDFSNSFIHHLILLCNEWASDPVDGFLRYACLRKDKRPFGVP